MKSFISKSYTCIFYRINARFYTHIAENKGNTVLSNISHLPLDYYINNKTMIKITTLYLDTHFNFKIIKFYCQIIPLVPKY